MFISFNRCVVCPDGQDVHSGQLQGSLHPHRGDIRYQHTQLRSVGTVTELQNVNLFPEIASRLPISSLGRYSQPAYATQVSRDCHRIKECQLVSGNSFKAAYILTGEIFATSIRNSGQ